MKDGFDTVYTSTSGYAPFQPSVVDVSANTSSISYKVYDKYSSPERFPSIDYKFNEAELLKELQTYIDKTYGQHYAQDKIQATEMIIDMGDGVGFCRGNIFKYAKRYGLKNGHNRDDLMKVLHYALMLLYVHDNNEVNS